MHFEYENENHSLTFRFDSSDGERTLEMNCNALFLDDILSYMRDFLQGCGYEIDGEIQVVPWDAPQYIVNTEKEHQAKFDFSNVPNNNWPFGGIKPDNVVYSPSVPTSDK